jgi:integrase
MYPEKQDHMKNLYRLFRRGSRYYCEHTETGKQKSLQTTNKAEALRQIAAENEAAQNSFLNLALARTYLQGYDPKLSRRTWGDVMDQILKNTPDEGQAHDNPNKRLCPASPERCQRAFKQDGLKELRERRLVETKAEDLKNILDRRVVSTNQYLFQLHKLAVALGWLPWRILPPAEWPKIRAKQRRAITAEEHARIINADGNQERRSFYQLLWEIGASQTDAAMLTAQNINWNERVLVYNRLKTGSAACVRIGENLAALLQSLPKEGPLFPRIIKSTTAARSAEFFRRCRLLGLKGISLHSYRYAWAERAKAAPRRA